MTKGINTTKSKKKHWKTKVERDTYLLRGAYLQNPDDADIVKKLRKKSKK